MTYGRAHYANQVPVLCGAAVSHSAELVRGTFFRIGEGPLIRPSATFSPRGEGTSRLRRRTPRYGVTTTRPTILPARRSSSEAPARSSGRSSTGIGATLPALTSASISRASAGEPT